MTPTNDERERMAREAALDEYGKIPYPLNDADFFTGFLSGISWADANPKPVGDLLTLAEEVRDAIRYSDLPTSDIILKALSRVAAETEARVIEECAKVCDNEEKEYQKSMEEFDRRGDTRQGTNEARCAISAKNCAELIRALASNKKEN